MSTSKISGLWPELRHDKEISGHQSLPGNITQPQVAWKKRLGGPVFDAYTFQNDQQTYILLIYGGCLVCHNKDGLLHWKTSPHGIEAVIGIEDIDDDGDIEIVASNGRSFFVFNANTGRTLCEEYIGPPRSGGFIYTNALLHRFNSLGPGMQLVIGMLSSKEVIMYDFSEGATIPRRRHTFRMEDFFHPSVLAIDIDNDGVEELVVTKLSSIFAFDPISGELKAECTWTSGGDRKRNYGLFEARDLNRSGAMDLLLLSYVVSRHIAVVENDGSGKLHSRWDRFIGHIYPNDETELRYCWNSCLDIDNDNCLEIVVSVWNGKGDQRWQTEVIDAHDGNTKKTFFDLYLRGIFPGRGDHHPILLLTKETLRMPGLTGELLLLESQNHTLASVWKGNGVIPLGRFPRRSATKTAFRIEHPPDDDIWYAELNGSLTFFLLDEHRHLVLLQKTNNQWTTNTIYGVENIGALLAIEDINNDNEQEFLISDWNGNLYAIKENGSILFTIETGMRYRYGASLYFYAKPFAQPVVTANGEERFCAVPDGGEQIHMFRWSTSEQQPVYKWSIKARGRVGPEEGHHSPSFIEWNGQPALLVAIIGTGQAVLKALALDQTELVCYKLPDIPANPPLPRGRTGIHEYQLLDTDSGPITIISGFRTGSMNSETTYGLNGTTGQVLWQHTTINAQTEAAFAPWNAMTVCGEPRAPQLVFLAKDTFCQLDARTGNLIHPAWQLRPYNTADLLNRGMSVDDFSAYGTPSPIYNHKNNSTAWILLCNYGGIGVVNSDHSVQWWRSFPLPTLTTSFGGIADIDNDGIIEVGLSLADGDFVCLRADTGLEKWRLHLGMVAADIVTCDINGDGRIEFILATREGTLLAIGANQDGVGYVQWSLNFDFSLGPPIIADFNNDGISEILVVSGDGWLYGIEQYKER